MLVDHAYSHIPPYGLQNCLPEILRPLNGFLIVIAMESYLISPDPGLRNGTIVDTRGGGDPILTV
jgi:hypothetical protein